MQLLTRKPAEHAQIFAEAQALVDDGLDRDLVLDLFAEDAAWLAPMLGATVSVSLSASGIEPSYYFEASLKQKFLAAGARKQREARGRPILASSQPQNRFRTAMASTALVGAAAAIGVVALGIIRSDDPGSGNGRPGAASQIVSRLDTHLAESEAHLRVIAERASSGQISAADIAQLNEDATVLTALAHETPLDPNQREQARGIVDKAVTVLSTAQEKPEFQAKVESTFTNVSTAAAAAGVGEVKPLAPPPTPTPAGAETTTASPTATRAAESPTPAATSTATPSTAASTPDNPR